jgi:metal-sulfur cluster biosynthetic enzyme
MTATVESVDPARLREALRDVEDPETGLNLVDLGLIYDVAFEPATGVAHVTMTLTSPFCPAAGVMTDGVERRLARVPGVRGVAVDVTFEPPWTAERISDEGKRLLGW